MLKRLYIKNLALIEETELELEQGLNIITGETGAGKSLVLGSLGLLLGNKADRTMIRSGCKEAYVEAVFELSDRQKAEVMRLSSIDLENNTLVLSRKIQADRNYPRINQETVTNKLLHAVSDSILNICGQRDNAILLDKDNHLRLLDSYAYQELRKELSAVFDSFQSYRNCYLAMSKFDMDEKERLKKLDYLQYVCQEIQDAALEIGEDESLEAEYQRMNHSVKMNESLSCVADYANRSEFSEVLRYLNKIREYDERIEELYSRAMDIDAEISDFIGAVEHYTDEMSFSEERYRTVQERLDEINHLKFKYGKTIEDILDYAQATESEAKLLEQYSLRKQEAEAELASSKKDLEEKSLALSLKRQKLAPIFCEKIREVLLELEFKYVEISPMFEKTQGFTATGFDKMGILISLNKGEALKPLETVASGGELSRIMLAIKSLPSDDWDERVLIFDEIDAGIGGKTALAVAGKLESLSRTGQVIAITHLASIAAAADYHYMIYKKETDDRTNTYIEVLDKEASICEVARMIGGDATDTIAIDNAKELRKKLKNERA